MNPPDIDLPIKTRFSSISVIGLGRFGGLLFQLLEDLPQSENLRAWSPERQVPLGCSLSEVCQAELIFLAVPISSLEKVLTEILEYVQPGSLIVDCSSVKEYPKKIFQEKIPNSIHSALCHPLFGPASFVANGKSAKGFRVSFEALNCPEEKTIALFALWDALGLDLVEMTAEDHDRISARTQFLTLLLAVLAKEAKVSQSILETVSSKKLIEFTQSVSVDEQLLRDYLRYNRFAKAELDRLGNSFDEFRRSLVEDA